MNNKMLVVMAMFLSVFVVGTMSASASADIFIHPDDATINVGVSPNAVSPPLEAEFVDWSTSGSTTYKVVVNRTSDGAEPVGCSVSGTITSTDQTVTLPGCKIPASDIGVAYHVYARADCPTGRCEGTTRSRDLTVDAPIIPTPEMNTMALTSMGLIGLIGLVRYRRKD